MKFYNQVLSRSFEITQCSASDLKVLVSGKFKFPSMQKDAYGLILRIPKPTKAKKGFLLNGIVFPNTEWGRVLLMHMTMSSVEHLSVHAMISDFSLYHDWLKGKNTTLAAFTVDLIEDLCVMHYIKSDLQGILANFALSNAVAYSTVTKIDKMVSRQILLQSALLSYLIAGRYRYVLSSDTKNDVNSILTELCNFEQFLTNKGIRFWESEDVNLMKVKLAETVYGRLAKYGSSKEMLYLPYTDSHAERISYEIVLDMNESMEALDYTHKTLGLKSRVERSVEELLSTPSMQEASNILYDLATEQSWKNRLVQKYRNMAKNTEFEDFVFPEEDYAEYYRAYRKYVGGIRNVLDHLRMLKNDLDSNPNQEIGQIDIQEVIQAIAAEKMNNNMFIRDDYLSKEETWCILLDMSSSLERFSTTTREMALCLAEVAKELIPSNGSWGLYAFSNKFAVIKDINEDYNANVKARIGGLGKGGLSYIPDALQLGTKIAAGAGKENNYLLIISDGLPSGYAGIEEKLGKTIKSVQNTGTKLIPVNVGSNGFKKYMRNASLIAETPLDLMSKFVKVYFEFSV